MIRNILAMLLYLCAYQPSLAQIDSYKNSKKIGKNTGILEVNRLNKLANKAQYVNIRAMEKYSMQALNIARKLNYRKGEASAFYNLGICYLHQSQEEKGRQNFKESLKIQEMLKDTLAMTGLINNIGISYFTQSNNLMALKYYQKGLNLLKDHPEQQTRILTNIGIIYSSQKNYKQALKHYKQAYMLHKQANNPEGMATVLNNIATIYYAQKKYNKALGIYKQNLNNFKEINDQAGMWLSRSNIGACQCHLKQFTQGITNINSAIDNFRKDKRKYYEASAINYLGNCYAQQDLVAKSQENFLVALDLAKKINRQKVVLEALKNLFMLYKKQKNYKKSLHYHECYQNLKDSIFTQKSSQEILVLQAHHEAEQREQTLKMQDKQIEILRKNEANERLQKQALVGLLITISIIGGLVILLLRLMVIKKRSIIAKNKELYQTQQHLHQAKLSEERLVADNLQKALDIKNQQLSSKALHIIQKNEILQKIKNDINQVNAKGRRSKELRQIVQSIDYSFSLDKSWDNFFSFFEEVHPAFFDKLRAKAPNLSYLDLRLCALVRLRFSSKEMATILGIAIGSVAVARHRVRKKLKIPKDQHLSNFIADV